RGQTLASPDLHSRMAVVAEVETSAQPCLPEAATVRMEPLLTPWPQPVAYSEMQGQAEAVRSPDVQPSQAEVPPIPPEMPEHPAAELAASASCRRTRLQASRRRSRPLTLLPRSSPT